MKYRVWSMVKKIAAGDSRHTRYPIPYTRTRGFTLLLAALVSSIVLSMGASIFMIAKKEVTLSSLGRDSQFAFYSADQAAECALYWDSRFTFFGTSTPSAANGFPGLANLKCDSQCLVTNAGACADVPGRYSGAYPYTMVFQYGPSTAGVNYCATVYVEKCDGLMGAWNPNTNSAPCTSQAPAVIRTTIHADGYNTTCGSLSTNPRALQRSVELHY